MQWEDRGLWTLGTVVGHGSDNYMGRSYKLRMMKTGCIITRTKRHMRSTPVSAEVYPREEMSKANRPQADNKLNEFL